MRRMEKQHKLKVILHFRKFYKLNPIFLHLSRIMEGCGQKRRTRHEEGRKLASVVIISVYFWRIIT